MGNLPVISIGQHDMRPATFHTYSRQTDGNVAVITAVALTAIVFGVGATMDYSSISNKRQKAQDISDSLSLAAAYFIGQKGKDTDLSQSKFAPNKTYKPSDFGYAFSNLVEGTDVEIKFIYDLESNEVRAEVSGQYKPTFASFLGKNGMDFASASTTVFPDNKMQHPASIAMVIDNSNSMWYDEDPAAAWDEVHFATEYTRLRARHNHNTAEEMSRQVPTGNEVNPPNTKQRIASLRSAFKSLNSALGEALINEDEDDHKYLRMGLIPFNHNFISSKSYRMNWGVIPDHKINGMRPSGETDTSKGMDKARDWLRNDHNRFHKDIRDGLKRYVIFMTDGHNTNDRTIQIDKRGSGLWRGQYEHTQPGRWDRGRDCQRREKRTRNGGEGGTETYTVCTKWGPRRNRWIPPKTTWRWRNVRQPTKPSYGRKWKEIEYVDRTRNRCDEFREKGYEVFSVGYALQPGVYRRNLPGRPPNEYWGVSPDEVDKARDLLEYCATTEDHFILADNAEQLEKAFEDIGVLISNESRLRIRS